MATTLKMRLPHTFDKGIPDVPQDVDDTASLDEHFNDPNWDASSLNKSDGESMEMTGDKSYYGSETDLDRSSIASSHGRVAFRVHE